MRYLNIIIIFSLLTACQTQGNFLQQNHSDTTKILDVTLAMATSTYFMSSVDPLFKNPENPDTAILTSSAINLNFLPNYVNNISFIITPYEKTCDYIQKHSDSLRNYLNIEKFERTDTGYYVLLGSLSCRSFGGGGLLSVVIKKNGDTLRVVHYGSSSIN